METSETPLPSTWKRFDAASHRSIPMVCFRRDLGLVDPGHLEQSFGYIDSPPGDDSPPHHTRRGIRGPPEQQSIRDVLIGIGKPAAMTIGCATANGTTVAISEEFGDCTLELRGFPGSRTAGRSPGMTLRKPSLPRLAPSPSWAQAFVLPARRVRGAQPTGPWKC